MQKGIRPTTWQQLRRLLEALGSEVHRLPPSDKPVVLIVDAMALIQCHQHLGSSSFHELQERYLKQLLSSIPDNCNCIHFVGDRYDISPAESVKGEEREKRMKTCPSKMKEYKPDDSLRIAEWISFVHYQKNKANLLNYMGEAWVAENKSLFLKHSNLFLVESSMTVDAPFS